jgi:hypothetical protein
MNPSVSLISDGRKFMWDGRIYDTADEASRADAGYRQDHFDTHLLEAEGKFLVYTRRLVQHAAVLP